MRLIVNSRCHCRRHEADVVCVEMEAAALYAYAAARNRDVVCFAHITNTMALTDNDFEKGIANGAHGALAIVEVTARVLT